MKMLILFFKSNIANRPGLVQRSITHKDGRTVKHWVRTGEEDTFGSHNTYHGDRVHYPGGAGEVVARGSSGVTVKHESTGSEHRVGWNDVHSIEQTGDRKPSLSVVRNNQQQPSGNGSPGIFGGRSLFTNEDAALGKGYSQPGVASYDDLKRQGVEAQKAYREWLDEGRGFANQNNFEIYDGEKDPEAFGRAMHDIESGKKGGMLLLAPVKGGARLQEKVKNELGGNWAGVTDFVRGTIAVDTIDEIPALLKKLRASGLRFAKQPKDRFSNPLPAGYRDALTVVKLPNGHAAELQLHVKSMLPAKEIAHKLYEQERTILGKAEAEKRPFTEQEMVRVRQLRRRQQKIYQDAWKSASGQAGRRGNSFQDEQVFIRQNATLSKSGVAKMLGRAAMQYFEMNGFPARRTGMQRPELYQPGQGWVPYYDLFRFDHNADPITEHEANKLFEQFSSKRD